MAAKNRTIVAVKAAEADTNLPPRCCDSIFVRLVYHHLTKPAEIDASFLRSLKLEGRLAVIDEEPRPGSSIPKGVPKNRVGHGIPEKVLINEFESWIQDGIGSNDWPRDQYPLKNCVVFGEANP